MPISLLAATGSVPNLGVTLTLTTAVTPGHYFFDVDVSQIVAADTGSVTLTCNDATLVSGSLNQLATTGAITCPQANGRQHIQLPVHVCSQANPGANFNILYTSAAGNPRYFPWAVWQTA